MITTYKCKFYTTKNFKYLNNKIDISGIIWNHCISLHKRYYQLYNKHLNEFKLKKHITKLKKLKKYEYWKNVNSQTIQDIVERIEKSYEQFFSKIKKKQKARPPKFQKVKKYKSLTFKQTGYKFLDTNKLQIQGKVFKYINSRDFDKTEIKTLIIKRTVSGIYLYVVFDKKLESLSCSTNFKLGKITGIDVGLKTFLTLSDLTEKKYLKFDNEEQSPEFFKQSMKLLKKLNRSLSRKVEGSNNWNKARISLAKEHENIKNKRQDYFYKLCNDLTKEYNYIFIEDLNIRAWKKLWGRKVSDIAVGEFFRILEYMGSKNNCVVHKISRWFPSSKKCSKCGYVKDDLNLKDREWICPECGTIHKRDFNAAVNIEREGISSLGLDNVRPSNKEGCYCLNPESPLL